MVWKYQVKKAKKVLGEYNSKAEAGRGLGRFLYNYNNLSLVKVKKKK